MQQWRIIQLLVCREKDINSIPSFVNYLLTELCNKKCLGNSDKIEPQVPAFKGEVFENMTLKETLRL